MKRILRGVLVAVVSLGAIGIGACSKKAKYGDVQGQVTRGGKPLANVVVRFLPDPEKETVGPASAATTDENGFFTLRCENQTPGAVIGWHRVLLEDPDEERPAQGQARKLAPRIESPYSSPASTPLHHEVKSGNQTIDIPLP